LSSYLRHIAEVLRILGYDVVSGTVPSEWNVLWTHEYSLMVTRYQRAIQAAKPHQMINHVAGSGYYTSKVWLATSRLSRGTPRAFELPKQKDELQKYAEENPRTMWVQKDNTHRDIRVRKLEEMDLQKENSFVQEFVANPMLIDKRKFDVGIYTVVTSLHPLRAYVYDGDALIRFCPEDYFPFDATNTDTYVVGDDYTPVWEMPSLKRFFVDQKFGWRGALDAFLQSKGIDSTRMWSEMHEIIAEVFRKQQPNMLRALKSISSNGRFFELSRFDFVVDENLNVFLMEANMSPNLSSGHFSQNQVLYEQVLFNVFSLVGVASALTLEARRGQLFLATDSDIHVPLKECTDGSCASCGDEMICQLCAQCMTTATSTFLKQAFSEHVNRRNMKMLTISFDKETQVRTKADYLMHSWRMKKCERSKSWC
uniref:Tubulin--tyrosine ligase-like protein 9 n=1 Tax=Heligmosomoides polygyrus TaxID=6339 RepID=A0A183GM75_HELPZ